MKSDILMDVEIYEPKSLECCKCEGFQEEIQKIWGKIQEEMQNFRDIEGC